MICGSRDEGGEKTSARLARVQGSFPIFAACPPRKRSRWLAQSLMLRRLPEFGLHSMDDKVTAFLRRYEAMGLEGTPASPDEVAALEHQLGMKFPGAYKAFLFILGRDGGSDFIGSDCTIRHLPNLRRGAEDLLRRCGSQYTLPAKAFVFLMHQGYSFFYFVADQTSDDPAVYGYLESDPAPVKKSDSFTAWLTL